MRRVVAFMGGSREALAAVSRTLPSVVKALSAAGVAVPRAGRTGNKTSGFTHQPLASPASRQWVQVREELTGTGADTVLLVVPGMMRLGRSTSRRAAMVQRLAEVADELFVVSVVGEQLTLINNAYLAQVATWRTSRRLDATLAKFLDNELFVHEAALRPWYDDDGVQFRAVPQPDLEAANPVSTVLASCGVAVDPPLPDVPIELPVRLGPVGVEANRLLTTYLRAVVDGFDPNDPATATASRAALGRAQRSGWCGEAFWGLNRRAAEKTMARFDASNHRFAQAVWGTGWTIPYPLERTSNRVELLDLDVQVVDQVHRYVTSTANRLKGELTAEVR